MSIKILAAGLSTCIDLKIVAPSFVTLMALFLGPDETGTRILSMPLGPRVVLTKSATAMAPTNEDKRAISPFYSLAPSLMTWGRTFPTVSIFDIL